MLSAILSIAAAVVVLLGIAYFVLTYLPYIVDFFNSIYDAFSAFTELVPPWLAAFAVAPLILFIVGVIIKLL